ncbi:hypothetical protein B0H10DRAFT_2302422 [Mycena sp. CBHHK59/15]|nr:hypothetical protein B0H10DRAFT_2302422 [Mycena sp. CBHHK59/15]
MVITTSTPSQASVSNQTQLVLRSNPSATSPTVLALHISRYLADMQWVRMISMAKSEFKLFLLPRVDNHTLRASMSCYCPTPSDSSHASQLIAAALRTPTPSPPPPPLSCKTTRIADPSDSVSESPPPPVPVYNLYGLDYGTDTTSDTGSIRLSASMGDDSQYEHLFPLKLPLKTLWWPPIPVSECRVQLETKGNGSNDIGRTASGKAPQLISRNLGKTW